MNIDEKNDIIKKISDIIPELECPMCHNKHFIIVDGYFPNMVYDDYNASIMKYTKGMPSVAIVCNRCGFISNHSMGALGLMKDSKTDEEKSK